MLMASSGSLLSRSCQAAERDSCGNSPLLLIVRPAKHDAANKSVLKIAAQMTPEEELSEVLCLGSGFSCCSGPVFRWRGSASRVPPEPRGLGARSPHSKASWLTF